MLNEFLKKAPTAGDLLALTPAQIDETLLAVIAQRVTNKDPVAAKYVSRNEIQQLYNPGITQTFDECREADCALMESWQRLLTNGWSVQASGQSDGMITLTTKGKAVAGTVKFEEIAMRQKLTRDMLHPEFRGSVYDSFAAGNYDTAVRDAMVLVEDAMRKAAGRPNTCFGAGLVKAAFTPATGKLIDGSLTPKEQQSVLGLILGAFGTIRNPLSHRKVGKDDPLVVIEELMLANRLMRFIGPWP